MPQGPQPRTPELPSAYKSPANSMDPINVLSDPHESNPNPAPASVDAAGKLQQLLGKTAVTEGGVTGVGGGSGGSGSGGGASNSNESSPESVDEAQSIHSTTSLRFAKGIVSGLFGRGRRCASDDISRSPTNSIAGVLGVVAQELGKGGTPARKRIVSPRQLFQKPTASPPRVEVEIPENFEDMSETLETSDDDAEGEFSVLTLVDKSRSKSFIASPGNTLSSVVTQVHAPLATLIQPEAPAESPPKEQEVPPARPPSASRFERKDTESLYSVSSSSFQIPAGSIIRQSSPSSFVTKTPTAKFSRQRSRRSGVVALTNVLSNPTYRRQITSLTPIDEYKLADVAGYQSFPPFVPSSGLGALFGNSEEGWGSMKRFPSFRKKRAGGGENVAV